MTIEIKGWGQSPLLTNNASTPVGAKRALTPLVLLIAGSALAQETVIEHCKKTSSDADRIACLEAALLGKTVNQTAPAAQIDPPSMDIEAGPADDPVDAPAVMPPAIGAAPVPVSDASAPEAPSTSQPEGIGARQVIRRTETNDERSERLEKAEKLAVASYDVVPYEKLQVTLENGQVWRQINGDRQRIKVDLRRNQTVDIKETGFGGYNMHLNEMRRTVRVERVQ